MQPPSDPRFRLAYVPGATPGKWASVWRERLPDVRLELVAVEAADVPAALAEGRADAAVGRLPVDRDVFSAIPLYEEVPVVCVSRDHLLAALDAEEAVPVEDLADETVWLPLDDVLFGDATVPGRAPVTPDGEPLERPATTPDALAVVAADAGVTIVPQSVARLHHRKDVVYRRLEGAPLAPVGLVWVADRTTDLVEEMIGIVRGRTVNSSRGRSAQTADRAAGGPAGEGPRREAGQGAGRAAGDAAKGRPRSAKAGPRTSGGTARGGRPSGKGKRDGKGRR
ncbi:LysR substrate-binding domain-containing protein [Antribacter sp. KLBMP9083]|uniref:LysR substrate-binding domain-containing protein n=1 Tax=Antribacter soli TaxID=2910976 RepID=A0AA41QDC5_9MICO|nr:LysR substrate-binding domain-containing protein [Antribacter soli]MCF4120042.1 LysR substrate-binding domain-containing protein [Antribacter soli]